MPSKMGRAAVPGSDALLDSSKLRLWQREMDARRTTYLAVGAAAVAVASPLLILFSPFLLVVWFALALVQLFAPARLPPWLNESTFMMHSGAALTSPPMHQLKPARSWRSIASHWQCSTARR